MKSYNFNKQELDILEQVAKEVDEVYEEVRKGVPQTKYIMEIEADSVWTDHRDFKEKKVPKSLVGFWMMAYPGDLTDRRLDESFDMYHWVKCKQKEVTVTTWVEE